MDDPATKAKKAPPGWGFAFAVFTVLGVGATLIAVISHTQQADSDRARFAEEARLVDQAVISEIESAFVGIDQVAHYLGQTLETSGPAEFDEYIEGSRFGESYPVLSTGILVVELVASDDIETFEARERQYSSEFEVRPMVAGYDSPTSWVVTRATNADAFGVNLYGADIAQLALALPGYLPTPDHPISVLPLSAFSAIAGAADDPDWEELVSKAASGEFRQIVMRWIPGRNGKPIGLIFASLNDEALVDELDSKFNSGIEIRIQLLTEDAVARPVPAADRATNSTSREFIIEGTRWHLTVWADGGFETTDRSITVALLVIGWIFAGIIAVGLLLRYRGLGELEDVQQELLVTSELAGSDALTGLINRSEMLGHIQDAIDNGDSVGVLFLDMDRFKLVNDTLGHDAGDELLKAVASRISDTVRNTDWVARFGGDEFVVLLDGVKTITEATATAQAIQARIQRPLMLGTTSIHPATSIGVAIAGESMFITPTELLRQADTAMYEAKRSQQSGIAVFDASMREAAVDRLALEQDLHEAVSGNQLLCRYQPIVDSGGETIAYEAIIFWQNPDRGLLPISDFQDVARQAGLIGAMTNQALVQVCVQISLMEKTLPVHLNVDAHVLNDPSFGSRVQVILTQSGVQPSRLVLEVSEQGLSAGPDQLDETLSYLSKYGVGFAVDGFGGGQTSLSLLTRYGQLSMVKVDASLVRGVGNDRRISPVVKAIVDVAHSLGLIVAAEGIESESDRQRMLTLGVERTQGPLHGGAVPAPASPSEPSRVDGDRF